MHFFLSQGIRFSTEGSASVGERQKEKRIDFANELREIFCG